MEAAVENDLHTSVDLRPRDRARLDFLGDAGMDTSL